MRVFIVLVMALAVASAGKECLAQKYPANETPMYSEGPKNQAMIDADANFAARAREMGHTREQASDLSVSLGWKYLMETRDLPTAMKRFNQAWLLDPENGGAYHGMAIIVLERDQDAQSAERLFKRSLGVQRKKPNVFVDYGRLLLMLRRSNEAIAVLERGVQMPGVSPDAQALLALAFEDSGNPRKACAAAKKVPPGIQEALKAQIAQIACNPQCQ